MNWNKYQPKDLPEKQNQYLDFFIDQNFQGVNRVFASLFENENDRTVHTKCYLPIVEIKDYNIVIDGSKLFDQQQCFSSLKKQKKLF